MYPRVYTNISAMINTSRNMKLPQYTLVKSKGKFYGKPTKMGNKTIIIIPKDFHKDLESVMGKMLRLSWEEVLDSNGKT